MEAYTLELILLNMKTGYTIVHDVVLAPPTKEGYYVAYLPHELYHRVEAHFGKGPFTTEFTLSHGPFMLHGYVKSGKDIRIPVVFEEK